jgi:ABC-type glucose/galactose transport system permease subunit
MKILKHLKSWEGFLAIILLVVVIVNSLISESFLSIENQINLFVLSIEKVIIVLIMAKIIINAEIDLSVASMMGLSACALGWFVESGMPMTMALIASITIGAIGVVELKSDRYSKQIQDICVKNGVWIRPFGKLVYSIVSYNITNDELYNITNSIKIALNQLEKVNNEKN